MLTDEERQEVSQGAKGGLVLDAFDSWTDEMRDLFAEKLEKNKFIGLPWVPPATVIERLSVDSDRLYARLAAAQAMLAVRNKSNGGGHSGDFSGSLDFARLELEEAFAILKVLAAEKRGFAFAARQCAQRMSEDAATTLGRFVADPKVGGVAIVFLAMMGSVGLDVLRNHAKESPRVSDTVGLPQPDVPCHLTLDPLSAIASLESELARGALDIFAVDTDAGSELRDSSCFAFVSPKDAAEALAKDQSPASLYFLGLVGAAHPDKRLRAQALHLLKKAGPLGAPLVKALGSSGVAKKVRFSPVAHSELSQGVSKLYPKMKTAKAKDGRNDVLHLGQEAASLRAVTRTSIFHVPGSSHESSLRSTSALLEEGLELLGESLGVEHARAAGERCGVAGKYQIVRADRVEDRMGEGSELGPILLAAWKTQEGVAFAVWNEPHEDIAKLMGLSGWPPIESWSDWDIRIDMDY